MSDVHDVPAGSGADDEAYLHNRFSDFRLDPGYLESHCQIRSARIARPFDFLPLNQRAVYILTLAGFSFRQIERFAKSNQCRQAISALYVSSCRKISKQKLTNPPQVRRYISTGTAPAMRDGVDALALKVGAE